MGDDLVHYLKTLIRVSEIDKPGHNFKAEEFCERMEMDIDSLMRALLILFMKENKKALKLEELNANILRRNDLLEEALDTAYNGNGRLKQMALVQSGLPIANNKKKSLADLRLRIRLGETDKEIMEAYNISRTTLWRWKKELEVEQQRNEKNKKNSRWW